MKSSPESQYPYFLQLVTRIRKCIRSSGLHLPFRVLFGHDRRALPVLLFVLFLAFHRHRDTKFLAVVLLVSLSLSVVFFFVAIFSSLIGLFFLRAHN